MAVLLITSKMVRSPAPSHLAMQVQVVDAVERWDMEAELVCRGVGRRTPLPQALLSYPQHHIHRVKVLGAQGPDVLDMALGHDQEMFGRTGGQRHEDQALLVLEDHLEG